jgi:cytoskeletal protein RodZ
MRQPSRRAPGYDVFKSIVAIILLILFLFLKGKAASQSPASTSTPDTNATIVPTSLTSRSLSPTSLPPSATKAAVSTQTPLPSPTTNDAPASTDTPPSARTETASALSTGTSLPSPTTTNVPEPAATPLSSPTGTLVPPSPSPPIAGAPVRSACDSASSRSRLQNGMNATILRRLNFRSSPGIRDNWLLTNSPGTQVQIVAGPECIQHTSGAYVWWQIRLPDGQMGWSAEASQYGSFYFMEPTQ